MSSEIMGISCEDIALDELIWGRGYFGVVRRGTWTREQRHRIVAVEVMSSYEVSREVLVCYIAEATKIKHKSLIKILGYSVNENDISCLVMEHYNSCRLSDYLKEKKCSLMKEQLISIAHQVGSAMKYLEENRFVHGDIAARNVLVNQKGEPFVKLVSAGLLRFVGKDEVNRVTSFARRWQAPELLTTTTKDFTHKTDIWSFGVFLWELYSQGEVPFGKDLTSDEVSYMVMSGDTLPRPSQCEEPIYRLMKFCWNQLPNNRPNFLQLSKRMENFRGDFSMSTATQSVASEYKSSVAYEPDAFDASEDDDLDFDQPRTRVVKQNVIGYSKRSRKSSKW